VPLAPPPPWVVLDRLPPALFLDVDGTLLEFEAHPDDVRATAALISLLRAVDDCLGGALAIISGRSVADLDRVFDPWRPWAAGVHGVEVRGPQGLRRHVPDPAAVALLRSRAGELAAQTPGVWVEDKGVGVTLHHRAAPEADAAVRAMAAELADELDGAYEIQPGVFTQELRPAGWDKGRAVAELLAMAPFTGRVPVVMGDDRTDEDAFAVANRLGGTAVIVGDRSDTVATHRLADPAAVRAWLAELVEGAGR
jgi:trehalose 6-phosphate phosphatase